MCHVIGEECFALKSNRLMQVPSKKQENIINNRRDLIALA